MLFIVAWDCASPVEGVAAELIFIDAQLSAAEMNGIFIDTRLVSFVSSDASSGRKSAYCVTSVTSS